MLLIPDGAYTHQLVALADQQAAAAYVDAHLVPGQSFLSFRALDPADSTGRPGEALVMVREDNRPDIVRPYSFTDLAGAYDFLESEFGPTRDPERVHFFWAEPVSLPLGKGAPAPASAEAPAQPVPVAQPETATVERGARSNMFAKTKHAAAPTPELAAPAQEPGLVSRIKAWPGWDGLVPVMVNASLGQRKTYYEAMDDDEHANGRAAIIVMFGAIAAAAGAVGDGTLAPALHFAGLLAGFAAAAALMMGIARLTVAGNRPDAHARRLLVALGFAFSPAVLLVLGFVPIFGPLLVLGILIWLGVTMVVTAMTALDAETEAALIIAFGGWMALFSLGLLVPEILT
jgi:hypothetical protein